VGLGLSPEIVLLYRFIYRGNGDFQEYSDYRLSSSLPGGGSTSTTASAVTFVPYGNIASTNVQAALQELDDEKLSSITDHDHTGDVGDGGTLKGAFIKADTNDGSTDAVTGLDSSDNEIFAIDSDGKANFNRVFIGSDTPSYPTSYYHLIASDGTIKTALLVGETTARFGTYSSHFLELMTDGTARVGISDYGSVGIGVTPRTGAKFDVKSTGVGGSLIARLLDGDDDTVFSVDNEGDTYVAGTI
jgi:hypothetical protein